MSVFSQGTVHEAGADLRAAIEGDPESRALWEP
jgi:hypothetical protein